MIAGSACTSAKILPCLAVGAMSPDTSGEYVKCSPVAFSGKSSNIFHPIDLLSLFKLLIRFTVKFCLFNLVLNAALSFYNVL